MISERRDRLGAEAVATTGSLCFAVMDVAMQAIAAPAVLIRAAGPALSVLQMNALGEAEYLRDGRALFEGVREALTTPGQGAWTVSRIPTDALGGEVFLAVRAVGDGDPAPRLRRVAQRLELAPRQLEVLERLVQGESNRDIAVWLGCAEQTVEAHVTGLLRRAGVSSQAELTAKFWTNRL